MEGDVSGAVVGLQTLYSVNMKRDALHAKLNHTNAPLSTAIGIAQLKAAWEGLFKEYLEKHNNTAHSIGFASVRSDA